jgi:group I intron endonuclease
MADTHNTLNACPCKLDGCGIYSITSPGGGQYIGSTVSFKKRWYEHRRILRHGTHHSAALQAAANKYGVDTLVFAVEELCSSGDRLAVEQRYLDALRPRYNTAKDAKAPTLGTKRSAESRAKMRASHLGVKPSPESRVKAVESRKGYRHSEETKRKIGDANAGRKCTPEQIEKNRNARKVSGKDHPMWGRPCSAALKARLSEVHTGKIISEDIRRRTSETMKGMNVGGNNPLARAVICKETSMLFPSMADAVLWLKSIGKEKASSAAVGAVCRGNTRLRTAYGYVWRYADPKR